MVEIIDRVSAALTAGKTRDARNWLTVAFHFNQATACRRLRRLGVLRASKYQYQSKSLLAAVEHLLQAQPVLRLEAESLAYLGSIRALLTVTPGIRSLYTGAMDVLRSKKAVVIKSIAAAVDLHFLVGKHGDRDRDTEDHEFYSQEDFAESFSFLAANFNRQIGIRDEHFKHIDETGLLSGKYHRLLIDAAKIRAYHEAEVLVDAFGYAARRDGNLVTIEPPDQVFEKSIRLGYIQTDMQLTTDGIRDVLDYEDALSVSQFARKIFDATGEQLIQLVERPIPRFVLRFPNVPEVVQMFSDDRFFREDVSYLRRACKENYANLDDLLQSPIADGLQVIEVVKIQRLLNFLRSLMAARFAPINDERLALVLRSIVPVFKRESLRDVLASCVSSAAADTFIRITSYGVDEDGMFDVQYQPIFAGEDFLMVPTNVLASSNLLRNLLYTQRRKIMHQSAGDRMQKILSNALRQRGFRVIENARIRSDGKSLEADIVAQIDDVLLVLECKTAFHPCGAHELRTSYDHIEKGASQLDRLYDVLAEAKAQAEQFRNWSWPLLSIRTIRTCIVVGNRIFNGHSQHGHPVRQAYEMVNVLTSGANMLGDDVFRVWRGEVFQPDDLWDYLSGSTTHADFFDSMEPRTIEYRCGGKRLGFATFALVIPRFMERTRQRYVRVGKSDAPDPEALMKALDPGAAPN